MIRHAIYVALAFCLAALVVGTDLYAADQIVRQYQTVRTSAMGGVHLTTGLYDQNFTGNPARMTANPTWKVQLPDMIVEANSGGLGLVDDITAGVNSELVDSALGTNNHARVMSAFPGFYWPNAVGSNFSFGVALLTSVQLDAGVTPYYAVDQLVVADVGPAISVARKFLKDDSLSIGATLHTTYRLSSTEGAFGLTDILQGRSFELSEMAYEGAHIDLNLGTTYVLPVRLAGVTWTAAATVNNLLGGKYENLNLDLLPQAAQGPRPQNRSFGLGIAATRPSHGICKNTTVALELTDIGNNANGSLFRLIHIGAETTVFRFFQPRVGINQGYLAGGLGLDFPGVQLELATYGEELSLNAGGRQDRRFAFHLGFKI